MTDSPLLAETRQELASHLAGSRREDVGFVPTMGALHDGHARLMQVARQHAAGPVVVSIFVNPLQFGAGEDLDRYPRPVEEDLKVCEREGVDIVFRPRVDEVYPGGVSTGSTHERGVTVEPGPLGTVLEGAVRPGHFRGVLTVVAKLFGLVRPGVAVFGQKDYQQLVLVRRMVRDLCLGVEIVAAETQREPDGLALSSRNGYLDPEQRREAVVLSRALRAARAAAGGGPAYALEAARAELDAAAVELDYLVVTDPELGELPAPVPPGTEGRILVAGRVGSTRLIDNMPITFDGDQVAGNSAEGNA